MTTLQSAVSFLLKSLLGFQFIATARIGRVAVRRHFRKSAPPGSVSPCRRPGLRRHAGRSEGKGPRRPRDSLPALSDGGAPRARDGAHGAASSRCRSANCCRGSSRRRVGVARSKVLTIGVRVELRAIAGVRQTACASAGVTKAVVATATAPINANFILVSLSWCS